MLQTCCARAPSNPFEYLHMRVYLYLPYQIESHLELSYEIVGSNSQKRPIFIDAFCTVPSTLMKFPMFKSASEVTSALNRSLLILRKLRYGEIWESAKGAGEIHALAFHSLKAALEYLSKIRLSCFNYSNRLYKIFSDDSIFCIPIDAKKMVQNERSSVPLRPYKNSFSKLGKYLELCCRMHHIQHI